MHHLGCFARDWIELEHGRTECLSGTWSISVQDTLNVEMALTVCLMALTVCFHRLPALLLFCADCLCACVGACPKNGALLAAGSGRVRSWRKFLSGDMHGDCRPLLIFKLGVAN